MSSGMFFFKIENGNEIKTDNSKVIRLSSVGMKSIFQVLDFMRTICL
jgi:hypothetical protein